MTDAVDAARPSTPLTDAHRALGARLIEFGGWLMPVQYGSILEEHRTVRERVGLFDLSHMGELYVEGPEAGRALAAALVSDPPSLAVGRAHYSMICAPDGGIIDDLIVYRLGETRFLVVANAGNAADRLGRAGGAARAGSRPSSTTGRWRPACWRSRARAPREVLAPLTDVDLAAPALLRRRRGTVAGIPALVARTGYTGEDGFEVFVDTGRTAELWEALLEAVRRAGGLPIGLGARDTLRLEAGMPLYGNELDLDDQPLRGGPRPGRQARQAGRLRRARRAREGRPRGSARRSSG